MKTNGNDLARAITKAGMILLESGAETYRVEDTMKRIAHLYGATTVDSYATPTLLIISFSMNDELYHNIKRTQLKNVDLNKIDKVNDLSRTIMKERISIDDFNQALLDIDHTQSYPPIVMIVGAMVCTFGFALFFQGTMFDAISALIVGGLLKMITLQLDKIDMNAFFKYLVAGAFVTFASIVLYREGLANNLGITIISADMLLVPGLAITNAIRDSASGDLISGLARCAEAIFIAVGIALGSGMVFMLLGGY